MLASILGVAIVGGVLANKKAKAEPVEVIDPEDKKVNIGE